MPAELAFSKWFMESALRSKVANRTNPENTQVAYPLGTAASETDSNPVRN